MYKKKNFFRCLAWFPAFAVMTISCALAAEAPDDYQLIPGERAGFITKDITEKVLKKQVSQGTIARTFYEENWSGASDAPLRCVSRVFPGTGKELWVIWKSDVTAWKSEDLHKCQNAPAFSEPSYVLIAVPEKVKNGADEVSPWKTPEGIGLGSSLVDLEIANGQPITFSVSADTDGNITDWNGGKLASTLKQAMLTYDSDALSEQLKPFVKHDNAGEGGDIRSSDIPLELKTQIHLSLFTVALAE